MTPGVEIEARPNGAAVLGGPEAARQSLLPLWVTEREAEAILLLCAAAPEDAGEAVESAVFGKLGELLRAFRS